MKHRSEGMDFAQAQTAAIAKCAEEPGMCKHALFYYAVLGEWERFHAVGRAQAQDDAEAALTYSILGLEQNPAPAAQACESLQDAFRRPASEGAADGAPALAYALTKYLLEAGEFKRAFALVKQRLERDKRDTPLLNLVAKYLAARGETDAAIRMASSSLECNPSQRDMTALLHALQHGEPCTGDLYLSPVPRRFDVSFYTPAYNAARYLRGTLDALLAQNYPLTNVYVVDDGSTDETAAIAEEYPIKLVRFNENRGLAAARNAAFYAGATEFLGSVDADVQGDPAYAVNVLSEFENASPLLAGVGGRLIEMYTDTPADLWRSRYLPQGWYPWRMYFSAPAGGASPERRDDVCCPTFFLNGCNNIYRRSAVLAVGGYNEKYRTNAEDGAMCNALRAAGYHVAFTRYAITRHARRDTVQSVLKTSWNYNYWARKEKGLFGNPSALVNHLGLDFALVYDILADDVEQRFFDCVYIDFLSLFVHILLDLRAGVQEGVLSPQHGADIQHELLGTLRSLGERCGGGLYERVYADCAPFLIEAPEQNPQGGCLPPDLRALVDAYKARLQDALTGIPARVYAMLRGKG